MSKADATRSEKGNQPVLAFIFDDRDYCPETSN